MIGSKIGNYTVISELGRGGMAIVYLGEHSLLGTKVAIKVLNEELTRNRNIRERFLAEARNLAKMTHSNVVKVSDLFDSDQCVAFVMEHLDGETLKDVLDRGAMRAAEIRFVLPQMLAALHYVHQQQLIHRDIKPSNFMLDKEGNIKLMDFGIVKNTDASSVEYTQTGTGVTMGTPMYMSPEQITETKSVTVQSDVYSLGVVLWQLVTGKKPYDTQTLKRFQMETKIVNEPLEATGTTWDSTIAKATAKDPAQRYASMGEWWREVEGSSPASDSERKTSENATKAGENTVVQQGKATNGRQAQGKKHAWGWYAGIGVALVLAVGLLWGFLTQSSVKKNSSVPTTKGEQKKGNEAGYDYVLIGEQKWMAHNLDVETFKNGDPIPQALTDEDWERAGENEEPAWCYYENDLENGKKYGKLYNWYAVNDPRGLAPEGWHVPSDSEWRTLIILCGGGKKAGKKMKSKFGWLANGNGTNEIGFGGLPGGIRLIIGAIGIGEYGIWWSSSQNDSSDAWLRYLSAAKVIVGRDDFIMGFGCSIRCLRD
jgi:uncharacterized protein (TIGR02145 family)